MDLTTLPGYVPGLPQELNFRELGGQRARDGRTVKHGLLFRGSPLHNLTPEQQARIQGLGLQFILDLRSMVEARDEPDWVPEGAEYLRVGGMRDKNGNDIDFSPEGIAELQAQIEADPDGFMLNLYASSVHGNPAVHEIVNRVVAGTAPIYWHCTAGKDRTGICAAVILTALGVPDDAIMAEYLLTNEYRAPIINMPPEQIPAYVSERERERWAEVNSVKAEALQVVLDAMGTAPEARAAYLEEEFGLDAAALAELRDRYLE